MCVLVGSDQTLSVFRFVCLLLYVLVLAEVKEKLVCPTVNWVISFWGQCTAGVQQCECETSRAGASQSGVADTSVIIMEICKAKC